MSDHPEIVRTGFLKCGHCGKSPVKTAVIEPCIPDQTNMALCRNCILKALRVVSEPTDAPAQREPQAGVVFYWNQIPVIVTPHLHDEGVWVGGLMLLHCTALDGLNLAMSLERFSRHAVHIHVFTGSVLYQQLQAVRDP